MALVLPLRSLDKACALEMLKYHTKRNYVAYCSHREKHLVQLE